MSIEEAFFVGFIKRAKQYEFTEDDIIEVLSEKRAALRPGHYAALNSPANLYFLDKATETGDIFGQSTAAGRQIAGMGSVLEHGLNTRPSAPTRASFQSTTPITDKLYDFSTMAFNARQGMNLLDQGKPVEAATYLGGAAIPAAKYVVPYAARSAIQNKLPTAVRPFASFNTVMPAMGATYNMIDAKNRSNFVDPDTGMPAPDRLGATLASLNAMANTASTGLAVASASPAAPATLPLATGLQGLSLGLTGATYLNDANYNRGQKFVPNPTYQAIQRQNIKNIQNRFGGPLSSYGNSRTSALPVRLIAPARPQNAANIQQMTQEQKAAVPATIKRKYIGNPIAESGKHIMTEDYDYNEQGKPVASWMHKSKEAPITPTQPTQPTIQLPDGLVNSGNLGSRPASNIATNSNNYLSNSLIASK